MKFFVFEKFFKVQRKWREPSEKQLAYILIIPSIIIIFGLTLYPLIYDLYISLQDKVLMTDKSNFVFLDNYRQLFSSSNFINSIWRTLYFTIASLIIEIGLGLVVALILNQSFRGRSFVRTLLLVPWAVPTIVNAIMWKWIYNTNYGALNGLLMQVGLIDSPISWLGKPLLALNMIILADAWRMTPFCILMFLAAMQVVPKELHESASMDGANFYRRFIHITLPFIKPMILVVLVLRTMEIFRVFDIIYVLTSGGPANSTTVISFYTYLETFSYLKFGMGAAAAIIIALCTLIISIFYLRLLRSEELY